MLRHFIASSAALAVTLTGCRYSESGSQRTISGPPGVSLLFPDDKPALTRPVNTYSIVARDATTGELGVAVQSHWFSVGSVVPWAEAGVGAVATQSLVRVDYGPLGLALMRAGKPAPEALGELTSADSAAAVRQVAMIDAQGRVATHTGARCIAEAEHVSGMALDGSTYSCQANLMRSPGVPEAMADAFKSAPEGTPLPERLVLALHAAEKAGGDVRGRQSAAILVVKGASTGKPWEDRVVELRVEDHPSPVDELDRLLRLHRAYGRMNAGDLAIEKGDVEGALKAYTEAGDLNPGNAEMLFWTAVSLVNAGERARAEPLLSRCYADTTGDWRATLRRLPAAGLLKADGPETERLARLPAAK